MSFGNERKLNKELPIVIDQQLAKGRYEMSLMERRLMYVAMSKISADDVDFGTIVFTKTDFINLLNDVGIKVTTGQFDEELYDACKAMLQRIVEVDDGKSWTAWQWMSRAKYTYDTQTVELRFHDEMKPFLLYLRERKAYTKFLLKYAMPLQSSYAIKLFEYFRGKVSPQEQYARCNMTVNELREFFSIGDKYPRFSNFKQKVINQALKEINNKTDILVDSVELRAPQRGRTVKGISFRIRLKAKGIEPEWQNYKLYSEEDLNEMIEDFVRKASGQRISLSSDKPNLELRRDAKARVYYELKNKMHRLGQIKNFSGFINSLINQYSQDEVGLDQLGLYEME